MINSIALYADSSKILIIEKDQVVLYDLDQGMEVLIGNVENQLVASTSNIDYKVKNKLYKLPLSNWIWQTTYSKKTKRIFIIGVQDIEFNFSEKNTENPKTQLYSVPLDEYNITLKKVGEFLNLTVMQRKSPVTK